MRKEMVSVFLFGGYNGQGRVVDRFNHVYRGLVRRSSYLGEYGDLTCP